MTKIRIIILLIIFLMIGATPFANAGEESLVIRLETGDNGEGLTVKDIDWPDWVDYKIQMVNDGLGEFFVEVSNNPAEWQVINWLQLQEKTGVENFHRLDMTFDGGLNVARMQQVVRLMQCKGLERLALRYIPVRGDKVFIKIYFDEYSWLKSVQQNKLEISRLQHDYDVVSGELESLKNDSENIPAKVEFYSTGSWDLRVGGEVSIVSNGSPVIVPALELYWSSKDWMFGATGGYLPAGDTDQRFLAGSFSYLPNDNKFGPVLRMIYASENLTINGGYLQEGFGPTVGLTFRDDMLTAYLTVGIQNFDRRGQNRRVEPTINLGVKLRTLSF